MDICQRALLGALPVFITLPLSAGLIEMLGQTKRSHEKAVSQRPSTWIIE